MFTVANPFDQQASRVAARRSPSALTDGRNVVDHRAVEAHRVVGRLGEQFAQAATAGEADKRRFQPRA